MSWDLQALYVNGCHLTSIGGAFVPDMLGLGGDTIDGLLAQTYTPIYILFIFGMKLALTAVCLGFGLFGGIFSPSLVVGTSAGALAFSIGYAVALILFTASDW